MNFYRYNGGVSEDLSDVINRCSRVADKLEQDIEPTREAKRDIRQYARPVEEIEEVLKRSWKTIDRITSSYDRGTVGRWLVRLGIIRPGLDTDIEDVKQCYEKMAEIGDKHEHLWQAIDRHCYLNDRRISSLDQLVKLADESIEVIDGEIGEASKKFNETEDLAEKAEIEHEVSSKRHMGEEYASFLKGRQQEVLLLENSTAHLKKYRFAVQCYVNICRQEHDYGKAVHSQMGLYRDTILNGREVFGTMMKLRDAIHRCKRDIGQISSATMQQAAAVVGYVSDDRDYHMLDRESREAFVRDFKQMNLSIASYRSDVDQRAARFLEGYRRRRL